MGSTLYSVQHGEIAEIEFIQLKQNLVLALCTVSYLCNNSIAFVLTAGFHVLLRTLHNADSFREIFSCNHMKGRREWGGKFSKFLTPVQGGHKCSIELRRTQEVCSNMLNYMIILPVI